MSTRLSTSLKLLPNLTRKRNITETRINATYTLKCLNWINIFGFHILKLYVYVPEVCSYCSTTKHYEEEEENHRQTTDHQPVAAHRIALIRCVRSSLGQDRNEMER